MHMAWHRCFKDGVADVLYLAEEEYQIVALLDTPLIFYTFRIAVTSVSPMMVLCHTDRGDFCSTTDVLNLPEEGRRVAANFVAPLSPAVSPQAVCF
jgi:hypothetical protein